MYLLESKPQNALDGLCFEISAPGQCPQSIHPRNHFCLFKVSLPSLLRFLIASVITRVCVCASVLSPQEKSKLSLEVMGSKFCLDNFLSRDSLYSHQPFNSFWIGDQNSFKIKSYSLAGFLRAHFLSNISCPCLLCALPLFALNRWTNMLTGQHMGGYYWRISCSVAICRYRCPCSYRLERKLILHKSVKSPESPWFSGHHQVYLDCFRPKISPSA